MPDTRLIIFEGIMGSGKSTMATRTALELQSRAIPYRYYWESELPHPVKIRPRMGPRVLSPEEQMERSLAKWRAFLADAVESDRINVLDGQLFHVNVTNILKQDGSPGAIAEYLDELTHLMRPLAPRLVYYYQEDVELALKTVGEERGERWIDIHTTSISDSLYGQRHGLLGVAGWHQFFKTYRDLTDDLFDRIAIEKHAIENGSRDWPRYEQETLSFLGLSPGNPEVNRGNAHLIQGHDPQPSKMCFRNTTDRFLAVLDCPYKKPLSVYRFEVLPQEERYHDALLGERYRIVDGTTGQIVRDVIVWEDQQTVTIEQDG